MIYGLYNSAAGMLTTEYRQAVIANNLANADTTGFKRDIAVFAERQTADAAGERSGATDPGLEALSGGLWLGKTYTDYSMAAKVPTGNPLDIALDGRGFLSVAGPGGQRLLTRDGRLAMDEHGRLVTATDGSPVLTRGGGEVRLDPRGGQPSVNQFGEVSQDGRLVGQLDFVDVRDYGQLLKVGANRVTTPDSNLVPTAVTVESGYTEASSVQPLRELVSMVEASRAYQLNAQMISMQDQTVGRLIGVISR